MLKLKRVVGVVQVILWGAYFGPIAFAGVEGSITGTIVDKQGVAISAATVDLQSLDGKRVHSTSASPTGDFQFFPVIFGDYQVQVQGEGFQSSVTQVHVSSSGVSQINVELSPADKEMLVEVRVKRKLIQNSAPVSSTQINHEMIQHLPGGEQASLPQIMARTTPGLVLGAFNQTFFRGSHGNVQYQIDGVQMPDSPSSTFGEAFSPRNIDHMEVITGGIPAEYGERLAAVVNIVTKSGPEEPHGEIELNYGTNNRTSPQLNYGGSNKSGDFHYYFSANYNRTDRGLDSPQPQSEDQQKQGGTENVHNSANGNNQFLKLDWLIDNDNKLTFTAFNNYSFYQIPNFPSYFKPTDAFFGADFEDQFGNIGTNTYRPADTDDTQAEWNEYVQLIWKHTFSPTAFLQVAPYYKYSNLKVTNDPDHDMADPKGNSSSFALNRHTNNVGLKMDYSNRLDERNLVKAGIQLQASQSLGTIQVLYKNIQSTNSDPNLGFYENAYVQDDFVIFKPLILTAGVRFSATQFNFSGANPTDYMFQPRVGLRYLLTDTTKLHAFYGKLFQPSSLENLRVTFNQLNPDAPLLPYDIKAEKDDFYELGVEQQVGDTHVVSVTGYYKDSINVIDDEQLLNTSIAQPFNFANGYSYGAELSVRGQLSSEWSEYFNYSYNIAKGRGISGGLFVFAEAEHDHDEHAHADHQEHAHDDHVEHAHDDHKERAHTGGHTHDVSGTDYQVMDHVQLHTANAGLTYTKNNYWIGGQGMFNSGLRTGPNNSLVLPFNLTFNATGGYEFRSDSWAANWKVSLDILNVFNNVYPISIANGYNGSHYAAGRQFFVHLTRSF